MNPDKPHNHPVIALWAGILALAIAMGVGRFSLTPLLPLMLRDGIVVPSLANIWAIANYSGYLLGAMSAASLKLPLPHKILAGLAGVSLTTLSMAWINTDTVFWTSLLRLLSGVFSAWVLISVSSWTMSLIAAMGAQIKSGWLYTGVGLGITMTGLFVWAFSSLESRYLWLMLGLISSLVSVIVAIQIRTLPTLPAVSGRLAVSASHGRHTGIIACYGIFGFAYILPATYLPAVARTLIPDPALFGLVWPVFGTAATISVMLVSRCFADMPRAKLWAGAQLVMGVGTLLPLLGSSIWLLAGAALLIGGTLMVATMAGLQWAREKETENPLPLQGKLTTAFAIGQICGPLCVSVLSFVGHNPHSGFPVLPEATASLLLFISALWLWKKAA